MLSHNKKALVLGAGGFIGSHMVKRLKKEGYWVRGVDLKYPEFSETEADDFIKGDLNEVDVVYLHLQMKIIFLMKFINLQLIWVVQVLFLLVIMMQILCITHV